MKFALVKPHWAPRSREGGPSAFDFALPYSNRRTAGRWGAPLQNRLSKNARSFEADGPLVSSAKADLSLARNTHVRGIPFELAVTTCASKKASVAPKRYIRDSPFVARAISKNNSGRRVGIVTSLGNRTFAAAHPCSRASGCASVRERSARGKVLGRNAQIALNIRAMIRFGLFLNRWARDQYRRRISGPSFRARDPPSVGV